MSSHTCHNLSCYPCYLLSLWLRCTRLGKADNSQLTIRSLKKKSSESQCTTASSPAYLCHHALDPQLLLWFPIRGQDHLRESEWGKNCASTDIQKWMLPYSKLTRRKLGLKLQCDVLSALYSTKEIPLFSFQLLPFVNLLEVPSVPQCSAFFRAVSLLILGRMFKLTSLGRVCWHCLT